MLSGTSDPWISISYPKLNKSSDFQGSVKWTTNIYITIDNNNNMRVYSFENTMVEQCIFHPYAMPDISKLNENVCLDSTEHTYTEQ